MQAIIDDCLAVGLFDPHIYKVYSVLTSQVIQEQYHKIITDSRRKYKLPLEHFWLITDGETEQQKDEYGKENSIAKVKTKIETKIETETEREPETELSVMQQ